MRTTTILRAVLILGVVPGAALFAGDSFPLEPGSVVPHGFDCDNCRCCTDNKDDQLDECDKKINPEVRKGCVEMLQDDYRECKQEWCGLVQPKPADFGGGSGLLILPGEVAEKSFTFRFEHDGPEGRYFLVLENGAGREPNFWGVDDVEVKLNGVAVVTAGTIDATAAGLARPVGLASGSNELQITLRAAPNDDFAFVSLTLLDRPPSDLDRR